MYELIILSLLMRQPAHGYLIARVLNNIIGPIARASNGRLYPLLARLEEQGLISTADEVLEGRQVRTYRITETGRRRFHALVMETEASPREYQELFAFKVTVFPLIPPADRLRLIDHYLGFCQAHVRHLESGLTEPIGDEALRHVLQHRRRQWLLELEWAEELRIKEATRQ